METNASTPCPQYSVKQLAEILSTLIRGSYPIYLLEGNTKGGKFDSPEKAALSGKPILAMHRWDIVVIDIDDADLNPISSLIDYCDDNNIPIFANYSGAFGHIHAYLSIFKDKERKSCIGSLREIGFQVRWGVYSRPPLSPYQKDSSFVPKALPGFDQDSLEELMFPSWLGSSKSSLGHSPAGKKKPRHLPNKYKIMNSRRHKRGSRSELIFAYVMAAVHCGWSDDLIESEINKGTLREKLEEIELREANLWVGKKKRKHYLERLISSARQRVLASNSEGWSKENKSNVLRTLRSLSEFTTGHRVEHVVMEWMLLRSIEWGKTYIRVSVREIAVETCSQIASVSNAIKSLASKGYISVYKTRGPLSYEYQINLKEIETSLGGVPEKEDLWVDHICSLSRDEYAGFNNLFRRSILGTRGLGLRVRQCVKASIAGGFSPITKEFLKSQGMDKRQAERALSLLSDSGIIDYSGRICSDILSHGVLVGLDDAKNSLGEYYEANKIAWKNRFGKGAISPSRLFPPRVLSYASNTPLDKLAEKEKDD